MKNKIKEFLKFVSSSLASTVVDLGLFALLVYFLRDNFPAFYITIATIIARIVAILVNYKLNATLVFEDNEKRNKSFPKYITLAIFDMAASALLVTLIVRILPINETFIKMLVDSGLFFIGYLIQRKYVFWSYKP